jgi:tetratricopeptide (TPR) repeat protein
VAQFGETASNGAVQASEELQPFDRAAFQALQQELAGLPPQFSPLVWHASLFPLRTRAQIPVVQGADDNQRAENAATLATQIGADLLFYGTYDKTGSSFDLDFYVSPRLKFATNEIIGADRLGAPIQLTNLADPVSKTKLNRELTARTNIASRFTLGLMYVLAGYPDDAVRVFEQVNLQSESIGGGVQELVYFFIGEEALSQNRDADALEAFDKALAINPNYARARLGRGGVYLFRADHLDPAKRLDGPELDQAIAEFKNALALPPPPAGAPTDVVAHLGLGAAYRDRGEAYLFRGDFASANSSFDQAIGEIDPLIGVLLQKQQYRLLAQAYLSRAEANQQKAYILMVRGDKVSSRKMYASAADDYAGCIKQQDSSPEDEFLTQEIQAKCKPYRQLVQDTLSSQPFVQ